MAQKLFLVHGMGKHEDGWSDPVVKSLRELYGQEDGDGNPLYPFLSHLAFDTRIELVEIRYDQIFERILERWKEEDTDLEAEVTADSDVPGWYEGLTEKLSEAPDSDEFFWTHAFDVMLYRLSPMVRQEAMNLVAEQMGTEIAMIAGGGGNWSVIAHSLGTAVVHDALHMLFTGAGFSTTEVQADSIIMVANVSRVLQTSPDVLSDQSTIRPGYAAQEGRGCRRYLNINHGLDPFTLVKPFDPDLWPEATSEADRRYINLERIRHIQQRNVHDLVHYLQHPRVHAEVFRAVCGDYVISDDHIAKALETFKVYGSFTQAEWIKIKQAWETIRRLNGVDNTWRAFQVLRDALERFEEFLGQLDAGDESEDDSENNDEAAPAADE